MNKFLFAAFVLLTAIMFCCEAEAQIQVPSTIDLHDPIVAESAMAADVYIWNYDPLKAVRANEGRALHLWGPAGKYTVKLTTITIDWDNKQVKYDEHSAYFTVVGPVVPDPDIPDPDDPDPVPTAFKAKVKAAMSKVAAEHKAFAKDVAANYKAIAEEAKQNSDAWDPATMVNEAKVRNTSTLSLTAIVGWRGFWPLLSKALVELKLDSSDLAGHIKAFEEIAEVLNGQ